MEKKIQMLTMTTSQKMMTIKTMTTIVRTKAMKKEKKMMMTTIYQMNY
jgi:hypothetical protein